MNSKQIIKSVIGFESPERIGWDFNSPHPSDFYGISIPLNGTEWGYDRHILDMIPGFEGQVRTDPFGNVWGRLDNMSKGEVLKGALEDGWEGLDKYSMPYVDSSCYENIRCTVREHKDKYIIGYLPGFTFSIMRTIRGMENFLMDTLIEVNNVKLLGEKVMDFIEHIVDGYAEIGVDAVMIVEDWGTQTSLLISPNSWMKIFMPWFKRLAYIVHKKGLHLLMHSCGYIYDIIGNLIDVGVDALQLDQPGLMGLERLSREFGGKVTFYCPVDIQTTMQTGNKQKIQYEARRMIDLFGRFKGGFIAKDYPQWEAINVKEQWAQWAREVFMAY